MNQKRGGTYLFPVLVRRELVLTVRNGEGLGLLGLLVIVNNRDARFLGKRRAGVFLGRRGERLGFDTDNLKGLSEQVKARGKKSKGLPKCRSQNRRRPGWWMADEGACGWTAEA